MRSPEIDTPGARPRFNEAGKKNQNRLKNECGESAGVRTLDLLIKSQLLYRLSYALPRITH